MLDRTANMPDEPSPHGRGNDFFNAIRTAERAGKAQFDCRVPGEDLPGWLVTAFAVVGMMIAVASASAWELTLLPPSPSAPTLTASDLALSPGKDEVPAAVSRGPHGPAVSETPSAPVTPLPPATAAHPATASTPVPPDPGPAVTPFATAMAQMPASGPRQADCFSSLRIPFARNSAQPDFDDVQSSVEPLRRWLSKHGDAIVVIEGHSDTSGPEDYNVLLSYARAKAIAALLKREGIPSRQTTIRAAGSTQATGKLVELASDRNAVLRIAGVDDCRGGETSARTP